MEKLEEADYFHPPACYDSQTVSDKAPVFGSEIIVRDVILMKNGSDRPHGLINLVIDRFGGPSRRDD